MDFRRCRNELLRTYTSSYSVPIFSYSNCVCRGLSICIVFFQDSFRCEECVRLNRSGCDVLGIIDVQLQTIVVHYTRLEKAVLEAIQRAFFTMVEFSRL